MNSVPGRHVSEETLSANPLDCGAGRSKKLNESTGGAGCPLMGETPARLFRPAESVYESGAVSVSSGLAKRSLTATFPALPVWRSRGCGRGGIWSRGDSGRRIRRGRGSRSSGLRGRAWWGSSKSRSGERRDGYAVGGADRGDRPRTVSKSATIGRRGPRTRSAASATAVPLWSAREISQCARARERKRRRG